MTVVGGAVAAVVLDVVGACVVELPTGAAVVVVALV